MWQSPDMFHYIVYLKRKLFRKSPVGVEILPPPAQLQECLGGAGLRALDQLFLQEVEDKRDRADGQEGEEVPPDPDGDARGEPEGPAGQPEEEAEAGDAGERGGGRADGGGVGEGQGEGGREEDHGEDGGGDGGHAGDNGDGVEPHPNQCWGSLTTLVVISDVVEIWLLL